jgi:hypothetical protein
METLTPIPAISVLRGGLPTNGHGRTVEDMFLSSYQVHLPVNGTHYIYLNLAMQYLSCRDDIDDVGEKLPRGLSNESHENANFEPLHRSIIVASLQAPLWSVQSQDIVVVSISPKN